MFDKMKRLGVIVIILALSFFMSSFFLKEVFVNNSPIVRPHLDSYIAMRIRGISAFIAKLQGKELKEKTLEERSAALEKVAFSQVAKGVSAREKDGVSETRYEMNKIKWVEHSYKTRAGTTITIKVPEGMDPPPEGVL